MGMINEYPALDGVEIGQIDIQNNFSFFEIDKSLSDQVIPAFANQDLDGLKLSVELSDSKSSNEKGGGSRVRRNSPPSDTRNNRSGRSSSSQYSRNSDSDRSRNSDSDRSRVKSKGDYRKKSNDIKRDSQDNQDSDNKPDRERNRKW